MTNRSTLTLIVALALLCVWIVMLATKAHAADDLVCKPYASQLLNNNMSFLWQRAFNHCTLLEEDNPVPPASGDWRAALGILDPDHTPITLPPVATIGVVPATEKPAEKPVQAAAAASAIAVKCKASHPAGFQSGGPGGRGTYKTVIGKKWVRVPC